MEPDPLRVDSISGNAPNRCLKVGVLDRNSADGKQISGVVTVWQKGVSVLKEFHRPAVLAPISQSLPYRSVSASHQGHAGRVIYCARLNHGGKKYSALVSAAVNR